MVAVDTSTLVAYLSNSKGEDIEILDQALANRVVYLPPVVLCEILSDPKLPESVSQLFRKLPVLSITEGYWERAGKSRSKLIAKRLKARLADTLIAQVCLDNKIPLLTRDSDFRHFAKYCGLELVI